jgi:hypothetical protein
MMLILAVVLIALFVIDSIVVGRTSVTCTVQVVDPTAKGVLPAGYSAVGHHKWATVTCDTHGSLGFPMWLEDTAKVVADHMAHKHADADAG